MVAPTKPVTVTQFEAFIQQPENTSRRFELIGGEIVEMVSSNRSSSIAARFIRHLLAYVEDHDLGYVTAPDGGYEVSGERYMPDVAYNSYERQTELTDDAYYPTAPELAVEVMSPTDTNSRITIKVGNYLAAGTTVWVVYPKDEEVHVYAPGQPVSVLAKSDTLEGSPVLPGFTLPLTRIFRD